MLREIKALLLKDIKIEWRNKYALNGILLYVFSTIFISYLAFEVKTGSISPDTWNAVFWIIIVFAAVNSIIKTFVQEGESRFYFYYQIASPSAIIFSKILYNILLMLGLSFLAYSFYSIVLGNPVLNHGLYILNLILGAISFSISLSLISGISSKTSNPGSLMVILSFPVITPILLILIRLSDFALSGIESEYVIKGILQILGINIVLGTLSYFLFPYLWRS